MGMRGEMAGITRRCLVGVAASTVVVRSAVAQAGRPPPVTYQTMNRVSMQLRPFVGRNMALLIDPARPTDPVAIDRILAAFDRAWDWYRGYFGRAPAPYKSHASKTTVAEVATGGGILDGSAGIELAPSTVTLLLTEAARDRYNQATFFVMGRNFWFYDGPFRPMSAFRHGFAHVHRFHSWMELA
jgi:hypothetical protein